MKVEYDKKCKMKNLIDEETGGSIVEYGLIIGFSLVAFVIIVGIVMSIMDWANLSFDKLFGILNP